MANTVKVPHMREHRPNFRNEHFAASTATLHNSAVTSKLQ
jgi:hypothetical protein